MRYDSKCFPFDGVVEVYRLSSFNVTVYRYIHKFTGYSDIMNHAKDYANDVKITIFNLRFKQYVERIEGNDIPDTWMNSDKDVNRYFIDNIRIKFR